MREFLENFSGVKVLILGDVMLDQYWWGDVSRISPEAPVPIVALNKKTAVAGGAANVAANVAGLGAVPYLIGIVGDDAESEVLKQTLQKNHVTGIHLISSALRPTTVKTRVIADNQQVVRVDREDVHGLEKPLEEAVAKSVAGIIKEVDVVLISDYAKGIVTSKLVAEVLSGSNEYEKPLLIDPKGKDYRKYSRASVLTPNQKEALDAANMEFVDDSTVKEAGDYILAKFDLEHLVITRGEKGMTLFSKDAPPTSLDTVARRVYDVTGAGDTVIATLAVAIGSGLDFHNSCKLANAAAGVVVETVGTAPITLKELEQTIR